MILLVVPSFFCACGAGSDVLLGDGPPPHDASSSDESPPGGCPSGEPVPTTARAFLSEAIGFGRSASGGANGCLYHVTSQADAGPGTLRDGAERADPLWIVFDVSGDIELGSSVVLGSNKTIDGRGQAVTLRNYGITIGASISNVIIENLSFVGSMQGSNNDAIQIVDGAHTIWIDHCSLSNYGDGLIDITHAATDVTVSWSLFAMHDLVMLIGRSPDDVDDVDVRVTLHHNWWNQTGSYAPRLRFGRAHVLNNLIDRWRSAASASTMGGELDSEGNVFVALDDKVAVATSAGSDPVLGRARSTGDWLQNGAIVQENEPDLVFQPAAAYVYAPVPADAALQAAIMAGAGAR